MLDRTPSMRVDEDGYFVERVFDELPEMDPVYRTVRYSVGFTCPICGDPVARSSTQWPEGASCESPPEHRTFYPCRCRAIQSR